MYGMLPCSDLYFAILQRVALTHSLAWVTFHFLSITINTCSQVPNFGTDYFYRSQYFVVPM